jgi:mono/diheme cytochrome c family protein
MTAKQLFRTTLLTIAVCGSVAAATGASTGAVEFRKQIEPILKEYCYDCHGDGMDKGGVAFDEFNPDKDLNTSQDLWWRALKNLRADMMPPPKKPHPSAEQRAQIERWIKSQVFATDPKNPDPGRITIRRLNRVEYRNTIRDLMGVDYDTNTEFPPDDTGHGFDNIGDVLTLPPMLLEKYLEAAQSIVGRTVPQAPRVVQEQMVPGKKFQTNEVAETGGRNRGGGTLSLSFYSPAAVSNTFKASQQGKYQLGVDLMVNERYVDNVFDYNKCRLVFKVDGKEMLQREFSWEGGRAYHYDLETDWTADNHDLTFELQPLTPNEEQTRTLSVQITSVTVRGPLAQEDWVKPRNYDRYFPRAVPPDAAGRQAYARELLGKFAGKAFRRPVDEKNLKRLTDLAASIYAQPGKTFEQGVSQAMVAVLASPRFLFREESVEPGRGAQGYALVDEYSLASRLSYFLWSSMPDDELFRLAGEKKLRKNLPAQVKRMLADSKSEALVRNFTGQWLRTRDIESVTIDARSVLGREERFDPEAERMRKRFTELREKPDDQLTPAEKEEFEKLRPIVRQRFRQPVRAELTPELRRAMRQETEGVFDYIVREDRNLLELVDSDYTFLNERLASHYGITNVSGNEVHLVKLPPGSPRGGILTQGTVLAVTSNPTRTSPVKRGLFILDNVLGTPPPPPPPNIPPLEDAVKGVKDRPPTLRETLAVHRENPSCSSCHNRMDPLGLAFENFNALGMWRDQELGAPVDAAGHLITGEEFNGVAELKKLLSQKYATSFYRTVTEKMLTYALGRGLEYYDVQTVDQILNQVEKNGGKPSSLLLGVVESAPFQKTRTRSQAAIDQSPRAASAEPAGAEQQTFGQNAGLQSGSNELTVLANLKLAK